MANYYISRGASEFYSYCERAYYLGRVAEGHGIEPVGKANLPIAYGEVFHLACAVIARGPALGHDVNLETVVESSRVAFSEYLAAETEQSEEQRDDQLTLLEGHIRGFATVVLPGILATDDIVAVEQDVSYSWEEGGDSFTVPSIVDCISRRRTDGVHTYHEWKTSKWADDSRWMKGYQRSVQLMVGCEGASKALGASVTRAIVHGFPTGYADRETGKLVHGLVNGWRNVSSVAIGLTTKRPKAWKGWEQFQVSTHPGGVKGWLVDIPTDALASCFTQTEPIGVDEFLVERWKRQEAWRAVRVKEAKQRLALALNDASVDSILDEHFRQNFRECDGFKKCEFLDVCWNIGISRDPLGSGLFVPRQMQPLEARIVALEEEGEGE